MRFRTGRIGLAAMALLALAAIPAGCGVGQNDPVGEVVLTEYRYEPPSINVKAGQKVKLSLRHGGTVVHDFTVPDIKFASGDIAPNEKKTVELTFKEPGIYRLLCTVPGHEALGMKGAVVVSE